MTDTAPEDYAWDWQYATGGTIIVKSEDDSPSKPPESEHFDIEVADEHGSKRLYDKKTRDLYGEVIPIHEASFDFDRIEGEKRRYYGNYPSEGEAIEAAEKEHGKDQ